MDRLRSGTAMRAVLIASLIAQPITSLYAQNTAVRSAPPIIVRDGQEARLNISPTGTPIVEVAAPDNNGTSHNVFERFNVYQEGTILNNSAEIANSLLAGQLLANPNFADNGREADLIIAEVLGGNRSDLFGPLEVFGREAGLVIANPAGITCDGCGFVGTPRVTLSTGAVQFGADGRFSGLAVTQGDVTVSGQGLLGGNVDYFDIVSLTAKINADLYTRDLQISAGTSDFDYTQRLSRSRGRSATGIAIDSSLLGGMFANRIRLVGNDRGVGINLRGAVASLQDDIAIQASGTIAINNVVAAKDLDILSETGSVNISDRAYASDNLNVGATGSILANGQFVGAGRDVSLQAGSGISLDKANIYAGLNADGTLTGAGSVEAAATGDIQLDGDILATQRVSLTSEDLSIGAGSQVTGANVALQVQDAVVAGNIASLGSLDLSVDDLSAAGNLVANGSVNIGSNEASRFSGIVASGEDLNLDIGGDANIAGTVSANNNLTLNVAGDTDIAGTVAANEATLLTSQLLELDGTISGLSAVDISVATLASDAAAGQILSDGDVDLLSTGSILFDGRVLAGGNLAVDSGDSITLSGGAQSAGTSLFDAESIILAGEIISDGGIHALAGKSLNLLGALQSTSDIALKSGETTTLSGLAQIAVGGMLLVEAGTDLGLAGRISTGATARFTAAQSIDNDAEIGSVGSISVNAAQIDSNGAISSNDQIVLSANDVAVDGQLIGGSGLSINASNIITETAADIQSGGRLSLIASGNLSLAGMSQSVGDTELVAGNDLSLDIASVSGGSIDGQAGNIVSGSGSLTALGDVSLSASEIDSGLALTAVGNVLVQSGSGGLRQAGPILSETGIDLNTIGDLDLSGNIASAGRLALSGQNLALDTELLVEGKVNGVFGGNVRLAGKIDANGDIGFSGSSIENAAAIATQGDISLAVSDGLVNRGALSALDGINLNAGGSLLQTGAIETAGALDLSATTNVTLAGKIAANGSITASALGILADGSLESGGAIRFAAIDDIEVSLAASLLALESVVLSAGGDLLTRGLVSGGAIAFDAVEVENSGRTESLTTTDFMTSRSISTTGEVVSIGALSLTGDSLLLDGNIETGSSVKASANDGISWLGTLSAQGPVSISGNFVELGSSSVLLSDTKIDVTSLGLANLSGLIGAQGDVSVSATSIVSRGDIQSGGNINLAQSNTDTISLLSGDLFADGTVKITGDTVRIDNRVTGLSGLEVHAGSLVTDIASLLQSGDTTKLQSTRNADLAGDLLSLGALDVIGGSDLTISGLWQSGDQTNLVAARDLMLDGDLLSSGTIIINAASIDLGGIAQSDQAFELLAGAGGISVAGSLLAVGNLDLATAAQIDVTGSLLGGTAIELAGDSVNLTGDLGAFADIAVGAVSMFSANANANIEAGGTIDLVAAAVQSAADILAGDRLSIDATGSAIVGGLIQSNGALQLQAGSVHLDAELLSLDDISIAAGTDFDFSHQTSLASGGMLSLDAGGNIASGADFSIANGIAINATGTLQSTGAIASGSTIAISAADAALTDLSAVDNIEVDATGALDLFGDLVSDGEIRITAAEIDISAPANLVSAGSIIGEASDGFTQSGALAATSDIMLSAGGDLDQSGSLLTDANVLLNTGNSIALSGDVEAALTVNINAARAELSGMLTGLNGVAVSADDILVDSTANLQSGTSLALTAANDLIVDGRLLALGDLILHADQLFDFSGDAQTDGDATLGSNDILNFAGSLIASGNVSFQASDLRLSGGTIGSGDSLSLISANNLDLATNLSSAADIVVQSGGDLNLFGDLISNSAVILTGKNVDIASVVSGQNLVDIDTTADLTLTNTAIVASGGLVDIDTALSLNNAGLISASMVDVTATEISNPGRIESAGTIDLLASGSLTSTGELASVGGLDLTASSLSFGGVTETSGVAMLNAGDNVLLAGILSAQGQINIDADAVDLQAGSLLVSDAGIALTGTNMAIVNGTIFTPGALQITGGALQIGGVVQSVSGFGADVQSADVSGTLFSDQAIAINSGAGDISISGAMISDAGLNLTGTNLTAANMSELFANGSVAISTVQAISLDGVLSGDGTLDITAGSNIALGGQIVGQDAISIHAGGDLGQNGIVETAGSLALSALDLSIGGRLTSLKDLSLDGGDIELTAASQVQSAQSIAVDALQNLTASGSLLSIGDPGFGNINLQGGNVQTAGNIIGSGSVTLGATGGLVSASDIEAGDVLDLSGEGVSSSGLLSSGLLNIDAKNGNLSLNGDASSVSSITLRSAGQIEANNALVTDQDLTIHAGSLLVDGTLSALQSINTTTSSAADITANGALITNGRIDADLGSLVNAGTISTFLSDNLSITTSAGLSNSGLILSGGRLELNSANFLNSGDVGADGIIAIATTGNLDITDAGRVVGQQNLNIGATNINSGGVLRSETDIDLTATETIGTDATGQISAAGDIALASGLDSILNGLIVANDALAIDVTGVLSGAATLEAGTALSVTGSQIDLQGDLTSFGTTDINAAGNIGLDGVVSSIGTVDLSGQQILLGESGQIFSDANISIAADVFDALGSISTGSNIAINADQITLSNSLLSGGNINLNATVGSIDVTGPRFNTTLGANTNGFVGASGTVSLTADRVSNGGSIVGLAELSVNGGEITIASTGSLESNNQVRLDASRDIESAGLISGFTGVTATSGGNLIKSGGTVGANGAITLTAGSVFSNIGDIGTESQLTIEAQSLGSNGNLIGDAGVALNSLSGNIELAGRVDTGTSNIVIASAADLTSSAIIVSEDRAQISAVGNLTNTGLIYAENNLGLNAGGLLDNQGSLLTPNNLQIVTASFMNSGTISSANDFALTANSIDLGGSISSQGDIDLTATNGLLSVSASLLANNISLDSQNGSLLLTDSSDIGTFDSAVLSASDDIQINGLVNSNLSTRVTTSTGDISLGALANVGSAANLVVNAGGVLDNAGVFQAAGTVTLTGNSIETGSIFSNDVVNVSAQNDISIFGPIDALGAVTVSTAAGSIEVASSGNLFSQTTLSLAAQTAINNAGSLGAMGDISLQSAISGQIGSTGNIISNTGNLTFVSGQVSLDGITSTTDQLLISSDDLEIAGLVQSGTAFVGILDDVTLTGAGRLHSDAGISINVGSLTNNNVISSAGTIDIQATGQIVNNAGFTAGDDPSALIGIVAGSDITLNATSVSGAGDYISSGSISITSGASDFGGVVSSAGPLDINASSLALSGSLISETSINAMASGAIVIETGGILSAGTVSGGGTISLTSGTNLSNAGIISGNQNVTLSAAGDLISAGDIFSNAALALSSTSGDIDVSGQTVGLSLVNFAARDIEIFGILGSNGTIQVDADRNIETSGQITGADIDFNASNGLINFAAGTDILSGNDLTADGARIVNTGLISAVRNIDIVAATNIASGLSADIMMNGAIVAGGNIMLDADDDIVLSSGTVNTATNGVISRQVSGQAVSLNGNQIDVAAAIIATDDINFNAISNSQPASVTIAGSGIVSSALGDVIANLGLAGTADRNFDAQTGSNIFAGVAFNVTNANAITIAGNASALSSVGLDAVDSIRVTATGSLQSNGTIDVATSAVGNADLIDIAGIVRAADVMLDTGTLDVGGFVGSNNDIGIAATDANLTGQIASGRDLNIIASNIVIGQNAVVTAGRDLIDNSSSLATIDGIVGAGRLVSLWPDQLTIGSNGLIFSDGDIIINAANIDPIAGTIQAQGGTQGDIDIITTGTIDIASSGSILSLVGTIDLTAGSHINQLGRVQGAEQVALTSTSGNIGIDGVIASGSTVSLDAAQGSIGIGATGTISVQGDARSIGLNSIDGSGANIRIASRDAINNAGTIFTDGSAFFESQNSNITNSGQITGLGQTVFRTDNGDFINASGEVFAGSIALLQSEDFVNSGTFTAANDLLINAPNITNSGLLGANGNLDLISGGIFTNTGTVFAGGNLGINAAGAFTNDEAVILALGNISIAAASVLNSSAQIESLGGSITINTGNLTNEIKTLTIETEGGPGSGGDQLVTVNTGAADIVSAADLSINSSGTITNSNSNILAGGDINITAGTVNNIADTVRRTVVSGLDNIVTVCLQAGQNGTGCSEPETGTVQQIRDLGLGGFLNRRCSRTITSGCLVSGDPTVTSVTSDNPLPTLVQAGGTLTINASRLGNGSFVDGSAVTGSGDMVPTDNSTAVNGTSPVKIPGSNLLISRVTTGSAANGQSAGTGVTQTGQNINNETNGNAVRDAVTGGNGSGVSGNLDVTGAVNSPGENSLDAGVIGSVNVGATGATGSASQVGSSVLADANAALGANTPLAPGSVGLALSTTPIDAPGGQMASTANVTDVTQSAGTGTISRPIIVDNQPQVDVTNVTGPSVEVSGIGTVNPGSVGDVVADTLSLGIEAPIANLDDGGVNTDVALVTAEMTALDAGQLVTDNTSIADAMQSQIAFSPATLAVSTIIGPDGGLGSFVFDFLSGFNLVNGQSGFDFANGNTLFTFNDAPGSRFLFTTNPGFSETATLFDSDYFFDQLDIDRDTNFLRLGDGFFESLLISRQIREATSQAQLPQFGSALDQAQALMQAAADQQVGLGLSVGTALTADQVASLATSIVWWVSSVVDGRDVLVPVVYLAASDRKNLTNGALLAGNNVVLNIAGDINNRGNIEAANIASLTAGGSIVNSNGGNIAGGVIIADAARDIINRNASITGGDILLSAGRDVDIGAVVDVNTQSSRTEGRKGRFRESASTRTTITGSTIAADGTLIVGAGRDLNVTASTVQAGGDLSLSADRNINIGGITGENSSSESWKTGKKRYGEKSSSNQVFVGSNIVSGGDLNLEAGRALTIEGSNLAAGGSARLVGTDAITIGSVTETRTATLDERRKRNTDQRDFTATRNVLSTVDVGGDLAIGSAGDLQIRGGSVNAVGAVNLAANNIDITGVIDSSSETINSKRVKKGLLSKKTTTTRIESDQELVIQSTLSGDTVGLSSIGDTTILGSNVVGTGDVSAVAGGDIVIGALQQNSRELEDIKVKKSGFSIGSGGLFIGKSKVQNEEGIKTATNVGSLIGSSDGNVTIGSNQDVLVSGSQVVAPGLVDISGKSITIENEVDLVETTSTSKSKSVGVSIGVQNSLLSGAQTVQRLTEIGTKTENARVAAVSAVAGGLSAKNTIDAIKKDPKALGGVNVSASIGFSKSKSENTTSDETVIGSVISAGDVALRARGAGAASTIDVIGSEVTATNDISALAEGAITFASATETDTQSGSSSSSGASLGVSVSIGSGGVSGPSIDAGFNTSKSKYAGTDVTNIESNITAGGKVTLGTPDALTLDGARVSGEQVRVDAGSLDIISRQDTSTFESSNKSAGVNVSVGLDGQVSGSVNLGKGKQSGEFASVQEQAGIFAGSGGFDIDVQGNTNLEGGVIASDADAADNSLNTGSLTFQDIQNREDYSASQVNIGAGFGSVGKDDDGKAATGGDKVPGVSLPGVGNLSATLPSALSASGSQSGTTLSAIDPATISIGGVETDPTGLSRDTGTANDGALIKEFDDAKRQEIADGFEATRILTSEVGTFFANRAQEEALLRKRAEAEVRTDDNGDPILDANGNTIPLSQAERNALENQADGLNDTYGGGSAIRIVATAFTGAAGSNVAGSLGGLARGAAVNVLQSLTVNEVKNIADSLLDVDGNPTAGSETVRAALQAVTGCAGAAVGGSADCGAAATGAAASVVVNYLLTAFVDPAPEEEDGIAVNRSLEDQEARKNLVTTIIAGIASASGVNAAVATLAAQIETENNDLNGVRLQACPDGAQNCFNQAQFNANPDLAGDGIADIIDSTGISLAEAWECLNSNSCPALDRVREEVRSREAELGLTPEEDARIRDASLQELAAIDAEITTRVEQAAAVAESASRLSAISGFDSLSESEQTTLAQIHTANPELAEALAGETAAVRAEFYKDVENGAGDNVVGRLSGGLLSAVLSDETITELYLANLSDRAGESRGAFDELMQNASAAAVRTGEERREAAHREAERMRASGASEDDITTYLAREYRSSYADQNFKTNLLGNVQFLGDYLADPARVGGNVVEGLIRGFDGVLRDETPVIEYLERTGQSIEDYRNADPLTQARIEGEALATVATVTTEAIAGYGVGRAAGIGRRAGGGNNDNGDSNPTPQTNIETVLIDADNVRRGTPEYDTLNNPPPNTRIELDNGNVYVTNADGLVDEVTFQPRLITQPRDSRQTAVGKEGLDTDVGGHIQACSLGGTCDRVNLFPQDANFNNSAYKRFEIVIRNALEAGDNVGPIKVKFVRPNPNNPRPDKVEVSYSIDGKNTTIPFKNEHGGGQ